MKKITLLFIILIGLTTINTNAQSAKEMLAEIEGKWELDDNNNITFVRIIEAPGISKEDIYNRVLNYFTYNYGSGKSVIQTQDKESGLVVGKGIYKDVHIGMSLITTYVDAWHILRVDTKDNKARAIITLTQYEKKITGGDTPPNYSTEDIASTYPINPKGNQKTVMTKAFYKTYQRAYNTLDALERTVLEGSTSESIENDDW